MFLFIFSSLSSNARNNVFFNCNNNNGKEIEHGYEI